MITETKAKEIFDSVAAMYMLALGAYGRDGSEPYSIIKGAMNAEIDITQLSGSDLTVGADLGDAVMKFVEAAPMQNAGVALSMLGEWIRAIENHVKKRGGYDDINAYLADKGYRVHPYVRNCYAGIAAVSTWPLSEDTAQDTTIIDPNPDAGNEVPALGSYHNTSGFTAGTAIDKAEYGDGLIQLKVVSGPWSGFGDTDVEITVDGRDATGNTVQAVQSGIADDLADGSKVVISTSVRFAEVTNISASNIDGASDQFQIIITDDRTPTL